MVTDMKDIIFYPEEELYSKNAPYMNIYKDLLLPQILKILEIEECVVYTEEYIREFFFIPKKVKTDSIYRRLRIIAKDSGSNVRVSIGMNNDERVFSFHH